VASSQIRLRQLVVATPDLDDVVRRLHDQFAVEVTYRVDGAPSHDEFSLRSATVTVGSQFIEIIEPTSDGAPAARHLARMGGSAGYMIILQVPSVDEARLRVEQLGIRIVWEGGGGVYALHLHPHDTGGVLLSLGEARPPGTWDQGGPHWEDMVCTDLVTGVAGASIACADPGATAVRWAQLLDAPLSSRDTVELADAELKFEDASGRRPHAPSAIQLRAARDSDRDSAVEIGGVKFALV
jgi:hypothetical protein